MISVNQLNYLKSEYYKTLIESEKKEDGIFFGNISGLKLELKEKNLFKKLTQKKSDIFKKIYKIYKFRKKIDIPEQYRLEIYKLWDKLLNIIVDINGFIAFTPFYTKWIPDDTNLKQLNSQEIKTIEKTSEELNSLIENPPLEKNDDGKNEIIKEIKIRSLFYNNVFDNKKGRYLNFLKSKNKKEFLTKSENQRLSDISSIMEIDELELIEQVGGFRTLKESMNELKKINNIIKENRKSIDEYYKELEFYTNKIDNIFEVHK